MIKHAFKNNDCEIIYTRTNITQQPTFLIPPFPGSVYIYQPFIDELLKEHPKADFINFTLPGLGGSNKFFKGTYYLAEYAQLLADFIKSFKSESFNILGTSLGGFFAVYSLPYFSVKPEKIVLVSPLLNPKKTLSQSLKFQKFLLKTAYNFGASTQALLNINYMYIWFVEWRKQRKNKSNKYLRRVLDDFKNVNARQSIRIFEELEKLGQMDLSKLNKEKLLITFGEKDIPDIFEDCMILKGHGYEVKTIKKGSHGYIFYDPKQTTEAIVPFLYKK